jgi:UDP-GlcNAc:undecaprenyl-phosphate GlcNAc-1-phosphate transferase
MKKILKKAKKGVYYILAFNLALIIIESLYMLIRHKYVNNVIPFWMTMPWGKLQLAPKSYIFLIPMISLVITGVGYLFIINARKKVQRHGETVMVGIITLANILLGISGLRIIKIASSVFEPLIDPRINQVLTPTLFSFVIVYFLAPKFIEKFKDYGLITDPKIHSHPGMLLSKPSARGGGLIFTVGVLITALFFIKLKPIIVGIFVALILASILGIIDDIQNTKPQSRFSWLENPMYRLLMQIFITLPLVISGVVVKTVNNPFNGQVHLDSWKISLGSTELAPIAIIFTILWIVWIVNLLSWSNGVDGQYSGVIGIAGIMIAIMTMRLLHFDPSQKDMMELAAIVAGASLGLLPYSWHPSKVMWGFGAISAGILLAALSIVSQAKIATSIIVLTVPFLDGAITVVRRTLKKQSPLKGDKGHLHHLLLDRGWSIQKVAMFYWISTAFFGFVGIYAADKNPILSTLTAAGIAAFIIISLNLSSEK